MQTGDKSLFTSQRQGVDSVIPPVKEANDRGDVCLVNSVSKSKVEVEVGIQSTLPDV